MPTPTKQMRIASYLLRRGLLSLEQAQAALKEQSVCARDSRERFGTIAVRLGYISEDALNRAITERDSPLR